MTASTRWNERAIVLLNQRPPANGQAAASRILTYLSLAQYRAVLAAEAGKDESTHPSMSAAVGGASVAVLSSFFPLDVAALETQLDGDLAAPGWPGSQNEDAASGESIGRAIGSAVLGQAATDNYLVVPTGSPPVGARFWVPNGPIVRSLHGVRPFFLTSASQIRAVPPPPFGSPAFNTALAEIRAISDTRTAEQVTSPRRGRRLHDRAHGQNRLANELIRAHHRTEREAARILAYANAAAFDAQIACWDAKLFYWYIRPTQADPAITLVPNVPLPNHPSYPSAHSCITGAVVTVLIDAFPSERSRLDGVLEDAGLSRMYAGLHYRFDIVAGQTIGRNAAALALAGVGVLE